MSRRQLEPVPLHMEVESSKDVSIGEAAQFLQKFLHEGVAIHAANNTVSAQLHQLHEGLREEKKRQRRQDK